MSMPKPEEASKKFFESTLPEDTRVQVRPMFGNVAGFVNGTMYMGLFGSDFFVRLSGADKAELLREEGASLLEPMKGRPMKEYVVIPLGWRQEPDRVRSWVSRSRRYILHEPGGDIQGIATIAKELEVPLGGQLIGHPEARQLACISCAAGVLQQLGVVEVGALL